MNLPIVMNPLNPSIQQPATSIQHPASSNQHPATSIQQSSNQYPASSIQHPPISHPIPTTDSTLNPIHSKQASPVINSISSLPGERTINLKPTMMSEKLINLLLIKLKVTALLFFAAMISLFSYSFTTSRNIADDFWKQLGMSRDQGTDGVKQSFLNGYLYYYGAKNARNIASGNRGALAKDLLNYTKQYINSEAFRKEYELMRKQAKPQEPQVKVRTKEDIRKEKIAETEESIKKTEEIMKQPNMKSIMQPSLDILKKNLVEYKKPDSKMIEMFFSGEKMQAEQQAESFKKNMARWEVEFPSDYREKVKERLQKFLNLSATVDFNAELKQVGNKKKFVNPVYEGKSYDWKQIYRAGKEVIEPAREFAEQWVKEIGGAVAMK